MNGQKLAISADNYLPLRDVVFNTLRDAILSGKLVPGERLMENQLAEKLGVSRTPIREALRMLAQENLVGLVPRKGAQVLDMSEKDLKDVLEVRASLESLATELACRRMSRQDIARLKTINREFAEAQSKTDYEHTANIDESFHDLIFQAAGNEKLIAIMSNLKMQLYRYRLAYLKLTAQNAITTAHHQEIIAAIESGDVEKGRSVAAEHIRYQAQIILASMKKDKK
ncbi:MAG: GntR family transcriptional regulator [Firmicutes bacterium]|nr:GntR family transcriptional regulator [Bacillota bacterium]